MIKGTAHNGDTYFRVGVIDHRLTGYVTANESEEQKIMAVIKKCNNWKPDLFQCRIRFLGSIPGYSLVKTFNKNGNATITVWVK